MAKSRHRNSIPNDTTQTRLRGFIRPVGASAAATYWLRRCAALIVLGLLVLVATWYAGSLGAASKAKTRPPGAGIVTSSRPGSAHPAASTAQSCRSADVDLRILSASWTGPGSGWPRVTIRMANQTGVACMVDTQTIGVLGIENSGAVSWLSASCASRQKPPLTLLVELPALTSRTWTFVWHHAGTSPDCRGRALSPSGSTRFYGLALGRVTRATVLAGG